MTYDSFSGQNLLTISWFLLKEPLLPLRRNSGSTAYRLFFAILLYMRRGNYGSPLYCKRKLFTTQSNSSFEEFPFFIVGKTSFFPFALRQRPSLGNYKQNARVGREIKNSLLYQVVSREGSHVLFRHPVLPARICQGRPSPAESASTFIGEEEENGREWKKRRRNFWCRGFLFPLVSGGGGDKTQKREWHRRERRGRGPVAASGPPV